MLFNSNKTGGNICIILSHKGITKEGFEDTKEVIRILKSKKDKQHNGQKERDKSTNNDLQNITHKTYKTYTK